MAWFRRLRYSQEIKHLEDIVQIKQVGFQSDVQVVDVDANLCGSPCRSFIRRDHKLI